MHFNEKKLHKSYKQNYYTKGVQNNSFKERYIVNIKKYFKIDITTNSTFLRSYSYFMRKLVQNRFANNSS